MFVICYELNKMFVIFLDFQFECYMFLFEHIFDMKLFIKINNLFN